MKIISAILVFCLTLNVFASTNSLQALSSAMDEYQYAMTVDWDQKDQDFKNKQLEILSKKMGDLFKQGLTSQDVELLVKTRFKNSQVAEAAKLKLALLGNELTPANVVDVLNKNSLGIYSQGAAWNGDTVLWIWGGVIVAIIAVAVAYQKWQDKNYTCTKTAIADYCTDRWDCDNYGCSFEYTECGSYERCIKEERNDI